MPFKDSPAMLSTPIIIRSDNMGSDDFGELFSRAFGSLYSHFPKADTPVRIAGVYGRHEGVSFRRMSYIGDLRFLSPGMDDEISFVLPSAGRVLFELDNPVVGAPGLGLAVEKAQVRSISLVDQHSHYGASIRRGLFAERLALLLGRPAVRPIRFQTQVDLSGSAFAGLKALIGFATSAEADTLMNASALMPDRLRDMLVDAVLDLWPHSYTQALRQPSPSLTPRHVKQAMDYLQAHPELFISGAELAAIGHTSLRALQEGFRRFAGTSISAYQRQVRLERAYQALRQGAGTSVSEVAHRFGFSNPGRFSQYFQKAYGVRPQDVRKGW
jgi:AraC-like DNA-binding protein